MLIPSLNQLKGLVQGATGRLDTGSDKHSTRSHFSYKIILRYFTLMALMGCADYIARTLESVASRLEPLALVRLPIVAVRH
eukprot:SAG31_NODE_3238_length_4507_cov_14.674682_6_plen_81_part_00